MPAPIPFDAPVTTATFPLSFPFFIVFLSFSVFSKIVSRFVSQHHLWQWLYLCETAIHKQFRSRDVAAVIGCEKHHGLGDLVGCAKPAERNGVGNHLRALLAH